MSLSGYLKVSQTATAGGNQATGLVIASSQTYTQLSTVATAGDSVTLPSQPQSGVVYTIRNDGVASANIFPPVGGRINALATNGALALPSGSQVQLVTVPNSALGAGGVQYQVLCQSLVMRPIVTYAPALSLSLAQSGSIVQLPNSVTGALNLPAPTAGASYSMFCSGAITNANAITITSTGANIFGQIQDASGGVQATGATTIRLGNATGAMSIGDSFNFWSDGTNWYVRGLVVARLNITLA